MHGPRVALDKQVDLHTDAEVLTAPDYLSTCSSPEDAAAPTISVFLYSVGLVLSAKNAADGT